MAVGSRVRVRLHGRAVGGWVLGVDVEPPTGVALQPLTAHSGLGPSEELLSLATWAAWRWAGPVSSFLATASPPHNVRSLPPAPAFTPPTASGSAGQRWEPGPQLVVLPPAVDPMGLVLSVLACHGPQAVVMVPSVGWAARLSGRLARRGVAVAADWAEAAAGWPVVVGARAAAWSPRPSMSAAIVLDAHDAAYRDERSPTADAVEVVAERARRLGVPCVLVSPCPTAVQVASYRRWPDGGSPGGVHAAHGGWPRIAVVDRRRADPRTGLFSDELVRLARTVGASSPALPFVCVLNRTGRARMLACAACGELARCPRCSRPLSGDGDELVCPACGTFRPAVCDACGATRLKALRVGVTRVREELEALLGVAVAEVSGPAPPAAEIPTAPVVVGTEAVLHRLRRASAVAFLDFDQHLLAARFAAAEEALALLVRAGRLVGGRDVRGTGPVLVQTRLPDHEVLEAAVRGEPLRLIDAELEVRRALRLPPAAALATVAGAGAADLAAAAAVLGVETSPLPDGRWLLRAADHVGLCDALAALPRPAGRLRVAVDPTDL